MNGMNGARIAAALSGQARALETLLALQVEQRAALDADDAAGVLAALAKRQEVIDSLGGVEREFREADAMYDGWISRAPGAERAKVEGLRAKVRELAGELAARDAEDRQTLRTRADLLSREMAELATVQRAAGAYGQSPADGARFQDRSA